MSSTVYGVLERADEHLAHILSQWSILTTILALSIAGLVAYNVFTWEDPDTSPFLLARQSSAAPIRNPGESATYRSLETPHGLALRSGLGIRDHDTPRWRPGRDGDLRDVWRSAVRGEGLGPDGRPTGQTGKILTVRGREEIVEHSIGMVVTMSVGNSKIARVREREREDEVSQLIEWLQASCPRRSKLSVRSFES